MFLEREGLRGRARALIPADPTLRQSTEEHFLVHLTPREYRRR